MSLETLGQLELWLQKAQRSLKAGGAVASIMLDSIEQQLLTCQVSPAYHRNQCTPGTLSSQDF